MIFTFRFLLFTLVLSVPVLAQKVAVIAPDRADASRRYASRLEGRLSNSFRVLDDEMSEAAFAASKFETPFNLTLSAAKTAGAALGCDYFILVKAATLRRSSSQRSEYYESHAAVYAVSSRTGRLIFWALPRFEASKPDAAEKLLDDSAAATALMIENKLARITKSELAETAPLGMEEPPDDTSRAKNFRAPIPYRRIKPEYTADAFLYDVTATVDITVDLDQNGRILRTEIRRWAGYGLDEAVEYAVRAMIWRPAERDGTRLPMRFLLRYNFRRIEKDSRADAGK